MLGNAGGRGEELLEAITFLLLPLREPKAENAKVIRSRERSRVLSRISGVALH